MTTLPRLIQKAPPCVCFASVIALCWLPVYLLYFPGNVASDGYWQIDYFWLSEVSAGDIHPPFSTYLLGGIYFAGEALGGATAGVALMVLLQLFVALATYTLVCSFVAQTPLGRRGAFAVALFYGLVPLFVNTGMTVFKDSLYLSLFVLFMLQLLRVYLCFNGRAGGGAGGAGGAGRAGGMAGNRADNKPSGTAGVEAGGTANNTADGTATSHTKAKTPPSASQIIALAALAAALCLFRKEGLYLGGAAVCALALVFIKAYWRQGLAILLSFIALVGLFGAAGLTSSGFKEDGISLEMMSIPLQQTARTVRDAPDDITAEEWAVLEQVFVYDEGTPIAEKYDPRLSDPLKGFNITIAPGVMADFARVYLALGLRHPEVYLQAFYDHTSGYYTPWEDTAYFYHQQSTDAGQATGDYELTSSYIAPAELRTGYEDTWLSAWHLPSPLGLLWSGGLYIWLLLCCIAALLHARQPQALAVVVPLLLVFVFCLLSPVNGNQRYLMPLIAASPLLIAFVCELRKLNARTPQTETLQNGGGV